MIDKNTYYTTSVCTGSWILGATGLLKDKNVSSNWYRAEEIMKMYGAHFKPERYVQDGKYWTSAGVTAGMDMALGIDVYKRQTEFTPLRGKALRCKFPPLTVRKIFWLPSH